jgi:ABC-type branched-subunit amino acid transport system substrate-binding protein
LLIRDDNGNGATDLQVAQKLATEDHIFAFVGGTSAPDDSGIAKVSKKYKIPDIGFPLTWERAENKYTYGVPGQLQRNTIGTGAAGTTYLDKTFGIKQVAIFWLRESEVSILNAYGFEATILKTSNAKIKICYEQPTGVLDNNYTNYVVSMKGSCNAADGPIAVYTTMENNANIKLAKAMKEQKFKPTVFAPTFTSYLQSFITQAEGSTEGAYIALPQIPFERVATLPQSQWTPGTYEAKRYFDTLHRYYPNPVSPGSFGAPGWGMAALFTEAAAKCGANLTRTCLFNALDTMPTFSAGGFLSPTKPSSHAIYTTDLLVQVRNGRFTEIKPLDRSGPKAAPDFWDTSTLYNWQEYFCHHQDQFPDPEGKKDLITEC